MTFQSLKDLEESGEDANPVRVQNPDGVNAKPIN
jgi:hypothetical protein